MKVKSNQWICPFFLSLLLLSIFLCIFAYPNRINYDAALLLQSGELLNQGEKMYVDFIPLDPPMIVYINAIPAAISKLFSFNPILFSSLFFAFFAVYCVLLTKKLFFFSGISFQQNHIYILLMTFTLYIICGLLFGFWGMRDFLFSIALVPFLVVRFIRSENGIISNPLAVLTGATFGIFCVFKHYFLIIFAINELYYIIKSKSIKNVFCLENATFLGICLLYGLHFLFVPQEVIAGYFGQIVPMLLENYHKLDISYYDILSNLRYFLIPALLIFLGAIWFAFYGKQKISHFLPPLLATFLAAFFMFFYQHKGWLYQLLPAFSILSLIAGVLYSEILEMFSNRIVWICNALAVTCVVMALGGYFAHHVPKKFPLEQTINLYSKENDNVLIISSSVNDAYPITVQMNRKPGSRYLTAFPLAFYPARSSLDYHYQDWNQLSREEKDFVNNLIVDINNKHPSLILIKNAENCQGCPSGLNEFTYLEHLGFMNLLYNYVRQPDINNFAVYSYMKDKSISN